MSTNKTYVTRFPANTTLLIDETAASTYTVATDSFGGVVKFDTINVNALMIYEWDLSTPATSYVLAGQGNPTVIKLELEYYHFEADTGTLGIAGDWDIKYAVDRPSLAAVPYDTIDSTGVTTITDTIRGDQKTIRRVTIGDGSTADVCTILTARIAASSWFALGLQKSDTTKAQMQVGGLKMAKGIDTLWHIATGDFEPQAAPALIVTVEQPGEDHIQHLMKYTTTDPTTIQSTPSNSIGGHASSNNVYTRAQISSSVSSLQTTIPISLASPSVLPTTTGLAQLGPEIFKYEGTSDSELTVVTRGISPPMGYPATVSPFAEYIHYLDVDNLFDRRPNASLVQYRCVALLHSASNSSQTARNTKVYLVQNPDSEVQVDIGIEVPKHDYISEGTLSVAVASGDSILTSTTAIWSTFSNNFFNGSHIVVDPGNSSGNGPHNAIIESFEVTSGTAEFIIDTAMPAFGNGEDFEINPAPSQIISNETVSPTGNSGRFLGFFQDGGSNDISSGEIRDRGGQMINNDVIYIWIKRTLLDKKKGKTDTGAVVITVFDDLDLT